MTIAPWRGSSREIASRRLLVTGSAVLFFVLSPLRPGFGSGDISIPASPGMSWTYNMTQELGRGIKLSDSKPDPDGKYRASVIYRLDGTEKLDGKDLLKFEMHRAGVVTNTDLITVDQRGIVCVARVDLNGEMLNLEPPQIIVAAPLQTGTTWDFDGESGPAKVHQHYEIVGEEEIEVPAGKFHAFHVHADQSSPNRMTIDRWFVKGSGIVKDVTETRTTKDELLRRISLELREPPQITSRPDVKPLAQAKKLTATAAAEATGKAVVSFPASTPKIYARWQGHGLRDHAKIRAVWVAENIAEDAPVDYTVDQASATSTAPYSHGVFILSRPESGWTPGSYRIEFYVDDALADTLNITIGE
jgi:hypothetical protein